MERTDQEIGAILRKKREGLGQRQDQFRGFASAATVRKIERGDFGDVQEKSISRYAWALGWPLDTYERLKRGDAVDSLPFLTERYDEDTAHIRSVSRAEFVAAIRQLDRRIREVALAGRDMAKLREIESTWSTLPGANGAGHSGDATH